jgi:nanoRNase/pAp phosphatase (c-di-AMP/oligoRNAs hydrolase)
MTLPKTTSKTVLSQICDAVHARRRFLISSHARPDGDSIGSQLAMMYALEALGKQVRVVNADPSPEHYGEFPGVDRIELTSVVQETEAEALIGDAPEPDALSELPSQERRGAFEGFRRFLLRLLVPHRGVVDPGGLEVG